MTRWGPTGQAVFERTYSRPLGNGEQETWSDTTERVAYGNVALVYGDDVSTWPAEAVVDAERMRRLMLDFQAIPAGRHLWATGVPGRQFLLNCYAAGWNPAHPADHATFLTLRLAEGGGVGANYSSRLSCTVQPKRMVAAEFVMDPTHPDYADLRDAELAHPESDLDENAVYFEVEDSREGWADAIDALLTTAFAPGKDRTPVQMIFDLSKVRPRGAPLRQFGGTASGPVPLAEALDQIARITRWAISGGEWGPLDWMRVDHAIARAIVSGGVRRSARMSIMEWDDPAIFDFIDAKTATMDHWTTNISVAIDDQFVRALDDPDDPLHDHAVLVLDCVVEGMLRNGEPGIWNRSLAQVGERGQVETTNPCGEISLEPWEACDLGHVNLEAFVDGMGAVDLPGLVDAHRAMARFLIRATMGDMPDAKTVDIESRNRRIGVGHFGLHGFLAKLGIRYSDASSNPGLADLLDTLYRAVRDEADSYADSLGISRPVKVTTVAPTGTIAKLPGASEGIHPIYARHFVRRMRFSKSNPSQIAAMEWYRQAGYLIEDDLYAADTSVVAIPTKERLVADLEAEGIPDDAIDFLLEDASEISLVRMLDMVRLYQTHYVDNGIAFTANVEPDTIYPEQLSQILKAYMPNVKGITIMPDGTRPQAPYERITREQFAMLTMNGDAVVDDSYDENCASGACPVR